MSMILEIRAEPGFLQAEVAGNFSLEEAKRTFREMLEAVVRHRVKKVLFDGRKLVGNPTTMERFYYGEFVANSVARLGDLSATQFAYVLTEPVLDPRRLGAIVAMNRGMFVKAFDSLEEALGWLRIAPAKNPDPGDG
jgi:hypothetical protein